MVGAHSSEVLEDEVHSRVQLLLQSLQIQSPSFPGLTVQRQDLRQGVDHTFSTTDQSLVAMVEGEGGGEGGMKLFKDFKRRTQRLVRMFLLQ